MNAPPTPMSRISALCLSSCARIGFASRRRWNSRRSLVTIGRIIAAFATGGPMAERREERRSIWRVGPESTWTTVLPVAFIIASLLSLVLLPIIVSNHTRRMRDEIKRLSQPAHQAANQMQIDLTKELDNVIASQVTGQSQYRGAYERLV